MMPWIVPRGRSTGVARMADREDDRLSQIATRWSLLRQARGGGDAGRGAWGELLLRYHAPVYRYLRALVRDEVEAEELCQEFALRFLRGDFRHANPDRGRFRDYLRVALQHLAGERLRRRPPPLPLTGDRSDPAPDSPAEAVRFHHLGGAELLGGGGDALAGESAPRGAQFFEVLRRKPSARARPSAALAEELTRRHGRPVTAAGV